MLTFRCFSFLWSPSLRILASGRIVAARPSLGIRLRNHWQAALLEQIHRAVNRDTDYAVLLVDPVITSQNFVLFFQFFHVLRLLAVLKHWLWKRLLRLIQNLFIVHRLRIDACRGRHRIRRRLMHPVVVVEEPVHADQDEIDHHPKDRNPAHEVEDTLRAQILVFVARIRIVPADFLVTHVRAPALPWRTRRKQAAAESNSGCGRSKPATVHPFRKESADRPTLRGRSPRNSARPARTDPRSAPRSATRPATPTS